MESGIAGIQRQVVMRWGKRPNHYVHYLPATGTLVFEAGIDTFVWPEPIPASRYKQILSGPSRNPFLLLIHSKVRLLAFYFSIQT